MLHAIVFVCALLTAGVWLRQHVAWFRLGLIPASLIAGFLGLAVIQWFRWNDRDTLQPIATALDPWPSTLIAVVFAAMLLGKSEKDSSSSNQHLVRDVMQQGLMVWIIVLGQTVVGLWVVWLWIGPQFDLPSSAGMLIETGFAGGHGTAAAMGDVFQHASIGWDEGLDLGVMMATGGLVYGLVSGIVWIQLAVRMGWTQIENSADVLSSAATASHDPQPKRDSNVTSLGRARIDASVIDPLLLQIIWLALAMGIGVAMQSGVGWVADAVGTAGDVDSAELATPPPVEVADAGESQFRERFTLASIVGSFPLFIYTLFGGLIVRLLLRVTGQIRLIDETTIHRISGASMDLLVVAAVATLNLAAVASLWVPLAILFATGSIWSTFCLLFLSRKILPSEKWFPLGLINFGMSTGTTATGFVLLRVVDPDLKSGAAEDYALAAPLSAPFVGGGMITVAMPMVVLSRMSIAWPALCLATLLVVLIVLGVRSRRSG